MRRLFMLWMVSVPLALGACGNAPLGGAAPGFDAAQLELDDGGFTESDELPMFGIEEDIERELSDAISLDEVVEKAENDALEAAGSRIYYLHLAWGRLSLASPYFNGGWDTLASAPETDWSGTVTAAEGVRLQVVGVARAEPRIAVLQEGPRVVSFQSRIFGHHDGLLLKVVADAQVAEDAIAVTFQTAAASAQWTTRDLEALDVVHDRVNAAGDRLAASAIARPGRCRAGFLRGRWVRHDERGGRLRGIWVDEAGVVLGHLTGIWGQRQSGERVFFAKVIDSAGRFLALVRGTWSEGSFRGVYGPRAGEPRGELGGSFRAENGRGFFRGRWSETACATAAAAQPR